MKLASRFTLLFALLSAAVALLLITLIDRTVRHAVEDRVVERLVRESEHLGDDLAMLPIHDDAAIDRFLRGVALRLACRITLVAPDGTVLHETGLNPADVRRLENHAGRTEIASAFATGVGESRRHSETLQTEMFYVARRLRARSGEVAVLRLAVSVSSLRETEAAYLWSARGAVLGSCVLLFLVGAIASRRFSKPLADLTEAASEIAAGHFDRDLPRAGGADVERLSTALQRMKSALSGALARAESERRLTSVVLESLPDALLVVDRSLRVVDANPGFSKMTGVRAPQGQALYAVLRHRALLEVFDRALQSTELARATIRLDDERVWDVVVQPLPEGARGAAVGVLRDVSQLERTEAMRRTFVADVSHELRTPIASITAAAETLGGEVAEPDETRELVGVIRRQSGRMRELIDDLMDLAQIESGAVELEPERFDLPALLHEVAEDLGPAFADKGIDPVFSAEGSVSVTGDRRRLSQVARNLLDNAIKFSPSGSSVRLHAFSDPTGIGFWVEDEGPGIPIAERDRIFQRFYQVDRSRSKKRPGSGLGLSIVKHLVQLHRGSVAVSPGSGGGTRFTVTLPPESGPSELS